MSVSRTTIHPGDLVLPRYQYGGLGGHKLKLDEPLLYVSHTHDADNFRAVFRVVSGRLGIIEIPFATANPDSGVLYRFAPFDSEGSP